MGTTALRAPHWIHQVTARQWLTIAIVSAAWFFDTLDQRLFSLARLYALADLMDRPVGDLLVQAAAKTATSIMLFGWGIGGLVSGALGDRYGHAKLMTWSILLYSVGSGCSALCTGSDQFMIARFVTGLGIGGVFGLAVAIIADTVKGEARLACLAGLQIVASLANMSSPFMKMGVDAAAAAAVIPPDDGWRVVFAISASPIMLALACLVWLRETDAWRRRAAAQQVAAGPFTALAVIFKDPAERFNLLIGTVMAVSGVVGLWGIGEFATDLQTTIFTSYYAATEPPGSVSGLVANAKNWAFLLQMIGGTAGIVAFGQVARRIGRRPAFIAWFLAAFVVTALAYWRMTTPLDAYWMMPLMGAAQLGLFGGFAIYLPELFGAPTRGTGVSFAYNLGRFAAAIGGIGSAYLTSHVFSAFASPLPLRYAAMLMCGVFLVGAAAAMFAPETRGAEFKD